MLNNVFVLLVVFINRFEGVDEKLPDSFARVCNSVIKIWKCSTVLEVFEPFSLILYRSLSVCTKIFLCRHFIGEKHTLLCFGKLFKAFYNFYVGALSNIQVLISKQPVLIN